MRVSHYRGTTNGRGTLASLDQSAPGPRLDLSSLVDVAFLLLAFFVLTATLDPREADLRLALSLPVVIEQPKAVVIPDDSRIEIDADGRVWCDEQLMGADMARRDLPALYQHLRAVRFANESSRQGHPFRVVVASHDEVSGQRFVDVLNCLAKAGISQVSLDGFIE